MNHSKLNDLKLMANGSSPVSRTSCFLHTTSITISSTIKTTRMMMPALISSLMLILLFCFVKTSFADDMVSNMNSEMQDNKRAIEQQRRSVLKRYEQLVSTYSKQLNRLNDKRNTALGRALTTYGANVLELVWKLESAVTPAEYVRALKGGRKTIFNGARAILNDERYLFEIRRLTDDFQSKSKPLLLRLETLANKRAAIEEKERAAARETLEADQPQSGGPEKWALVSSISKMPGKSPVNSTQAGAELGVCDQNIERNSGGYRKLMPLDSLSNAVVRLGGSCGKATYKVTDISDLEGVIRCGGASFVGRVKDKGDSIEVSTAIVSGGKISQVITNTYAECPDKQLSCEEMVAQGQLSPDFLCSMGPVADPG